MDVSPGHSALSDVYHTKSQRTNYEKFTASQRTQQGRVILAIPYQFWSIQLIPLGHQGGSTVWRKP